MAAIAGEQISYRSRAPANDSAQSRPTACRSPIESARASNSARALSATMNSHLLATLLRKLVPSRRQYLRCNIAQRLHAQHGGALLALGPSLRVFAARQPAWAHRVAHHHANPFANPHRARRKVAAVEQQRASLAGPGMTNTDPEFRTSRRRTRSRLSGTAMPSVPVSGSSRLTPRTPSPARTPAPRTNSTHSPAEPCCGSSRRNP